MFLNKHSPILKVDIGQGPRIFWKPKFVTTFATSCDMHRPQKSFCVWNTAVGWTSNFVEKSNLFAIFIRKGTHWPIIAISFSPLPRGHNIFWCDFLHFPRGQNNFLVCFLHFPMGHNIFWCVFYTFPGGKIIFGCVFYTLPGGKIIFGVFFTLSQGAK